MFALRETTDDLSVLPVLIENFCEQSNYYYDRNRICCETSHEDVIIDDLVNSGLNHVFARAFKQGSNYMGIILKFREGHV